MMNSFYGFADSEDFKRVPETLRESAGVDDTKCKSKRSV